MSDQARLMSPPPLGKKLARQRLTAFLTVAASVAVVAIICGIAVLSHPGSSLQHNPGPADTSGSPAPTQHSNSALTNQEYAFARDLVRREIRHVGAVVTSGTVTMGYGRYGSLWRSRDVVTGATVTVGNGTVTNSNIGYPCMSGRLLNIKLIGDFPHIATSPIPPQPGATPPDATVHAVVLTADAKTGRACLVGVQTGEVAPVPGAISLPVN